MDERLRRQRWFVGAAALVGLAPVLLAQGVGSASAPVPRVEGRSLSLASAFAEVDAVLAATVTEEQDERLNASVVEDDGEPSLHAYRRVILHVQD